MADSKTFREQLAKILVKWEMPTRQVALIEIVLLHEHYMEEQLLDIQQFVKKKLIQQHK